MIHGYFDSKNIDFIFFDKGGTLGFVKENPQSSLEKIRKLTDFLGYKNTPEDFWKILQERNKKLKDWSFANCYEETVEDMCRKWLFFDAPLADKIENNADELVKINSQIKGDRLMYPEAAPVIWELNRRGYRTGLISNTVSPTMVPEELKSADIWDEMEVVILSAEVRIKKPAPQIFLMGCRKAGIAPERCVYIGDQPNRDVEGSRRAGFAGVVLLKTEAWDPEKDKGELRAPDAVVDSLTELLDIFPCR
ncbi:MAG: HAD-IA family hydrolase [Spirochaetales bacterium]|nr:HAD-IA family hydrolase [Spirochaetales bacterium]